MFYTAISINSGSCLFSLYQNGSSLAPLGDMQSPPKEDWSHKETPQGVGGCKVVASCTQVSPVPGGCVSSLFSSPSRKLLLALSQGNRSFPSGTHRGCLNSQARVREGRHGWSQFASKFARRQSGLRCARSPTACPLWNAASHPNGSSPEMPAETWVPTRPLAVF